MTAANHMAAVNGGQLLALATASDAAASSLAQCWGHFCCAVAARYSDSRTLPGTGMIQVFTCTAVLSSHRPSLEAAPQTL